MEACSVCAGREEDQELTGALWCSCVEVRLIPMA